MALLLFGRFSLSIFSLEDKLVVFVDIREIVRPNFNNDLHKKREEFFPRSNNNSIN